MNRMRRGRPRKDGLGDNTDKHIIMQLRKTVILNGQNFVEFRNGDKKQINPAQAVDICEAYSRMHIDGKFRFQEDISASIEGFNEGLRKVNG